VAKPAHRAGFLPALPPNAEWYAPGGKGDSPVVEEILRLDAKDRAKLMVYLTRHLAGSARHGEVVKKLDHELWEIRHKSRFGAHRLVFAQEGGRLVILDVYVKKSDASPTDRARRRLEDWRRQRR
jgi:phage-related protein